MDTAEQTIREQDPYIIRHLDEWLDEQIRGDTCRAEVRQAMLKVVATDIEWWGCQSWWQAYDAAKCDRIEAKYR